MKIKKILVSLVTLAVGFGLGYYLWGPIRTRGVGVWDGVTDNSSSNQTKLTAAGGGPEFRLHIRYNLDLNNPSHPDTDKVRAWLDDLNSANPAAPDLFKLLPNITLSPQYQVNALTLLEASDFAQGLPDGWVAHCSIDRSDKSTNPVCFIELTFRQPLKTALTVSQVDKFLYDPAGNPQVRAALLQLIKDKSAQKILNAWPM